MPNGWGKIIAELRAERDRIDEAIAAIGGLSGTGVRRGRPAGSLSATKRGGRQRMSKAARKRISVAMKARWAAKKKGARPQQKSAAKQKRRGGITRAGRKRLSEMMKQRSAAKRKQAKSA
jgi:hypothetical protein